MADCCVVVADAARARFFTLEAAADPDFESGPNLVEQPGLDNPEATMQGKEKFSDTKSGRNMGGGGITHGFDDHRDKHDAENHRRFAQRIASEAVSLANKSNAKQLVITAEKQMLGMLRQAMAGSNHNPFEIREVAKDLTKFAAHDIHKHLAGEQLVPAHRRAGR